MAMHVLRRNRLHGVPVGFLGNRVGVVMSVALVVLSLFAMLLAEGINWEAARENNGRAPLSGFLLTVASLTLMFLAGSA